MNIALIGYGKMGRAIETVAVARGHLIGAKSGSTNAGTPPKGADVAIEFTRPDQALANIRLCLESGVPVVVGTTGWYDRLNEVKAMVQENDGSLLWASNFSIGVNLFFRLNRYLAQLMDPQPGYAVHIDEIHHAQKLDAPSGTAITLARDIDVRTGRYSGWRPADAVGSGTPAAGTRSVPIASERTGDVPGKHSVTWRSEEDRIVITHEAYGRRGFALGAVLAAEWLQGRKGFFTMEDVLDPVT